ncbi:prenyltransferase/squalene oxidase repeat-containing protein, partial [Candidatus Auribacterota bacterium]
AAWTGDIDHSSLVHLGERTATVWFGEGLLRDLLKSDVDPLRDKIFKHEKEHLLGNHNIDNEPGYDELVREVYEDRVLKLIPEDLYRKSVQKSADWLIDCYNPKTGLCDSYDDEGGMNVPDTIAPAAHIFDQSLWIMAMDSIGAHKNAEKVLKALSEIQNPDGSFYSAYNANDRTVIFDDVRLGPIAFVIMANNFHIFATGGVANGDKKYLNMSVKAADYLLAQQGSDGSFRTSTNTGGFASVEENIDCYSALYYLARITGDPKYANAVSKVKQFLQKTWDNDKGYFYKSMEYLFFFGTPNQGIAYDTSVWGYLLMGDKGEQGELYARGLDFIKKNLLNSEDTGLVHLDENKQFEGAFWVDPTIWYAIARLKRGDMGEAFHYFNNMLKLQTEKGGYPLNHWLNRGKPDDSHPNPVWPLYPFEGIHPAAASVFFYNTLKKPDFNIFHPTINVGSPLSGMTVKELPVPEDQPTPPIDIDIDPVSEDILSSAA